MKHFDEDNWADFVRNVIPQAQEMSMREHLGKGCKKCRQRMELMRQVFAVAEADNKNPVPEFAVRVAKAIFAVQQPTRVRRLPSLRPRLTFDSFLAPAAVGMRGERSTRRQMCYQAKDFSLDLLIEREQGGPHMTLVGQISNLKDPSKPMSEVPVFLRYGKSIVAHAVSNQFGEFQTEYKPQRGLRLHLLLEDGGLGLEISLDRCNVAASQA